MSRGTTLTRDELESISDLWVDLVDQECEHIEAETCNTFDALMRVSWLRLYHTAMGMCRAEYEAHLAELWLDKERSADKIPEYAEAKEQADAFTFMQDLKLIELVERKIDDGLRQPEPEDFVGVTSHMAIGIRILWMRSDPVDNQEELAKYHKAKGTFDGLDHEQMASLAKLKQKKFIVTRTVRDGPKGAFGTTPTTCSMQAESLKALVVDLYNETIEEDDDRTDEQIVSELQCDLFDNGGFCLIFDVEADEQVFQVCP